MSVRSDCVDALRAIALVWMTLFHLCFDLSHFGWWQQDFRSDTFWTVQRTLIVSLFLLCAGLGQAMTIKDGVDAGKFYRRWGQIVVCALLVSAASLVMFPGSFIYFGVLHGMALMLLLCRFGRAKYHHARKLWLVGLIAMLSPSFARWILTGPLAMWADTFNAPTLNWLGWVTRKPVTEDYLPLFPWLGIMLWGVACGQWLLLRRFAWLTAPTRGVTRRLAVLGRYSLSYYMLHQPVLIAFFLFVDWLQP